MLLYLNFRLRAFGLVRKYVCYFKKLLCYSSPGKWVHSCLSTWLEKNPELFKTETFCLFLIYNQAAEQCWGKSHQAPGTLHIPWYSASDSIPSQSPWLAPLYQSDSKCWRVLGLHPSLLFSSNILRDPSYRLQKHIFADASHRSFFNLNLLFQSPDSYI